MRAAPERSTILKGVVKVAKATGVADRRNRRRILRSVNVNNASIHFCVKAMVSMHLIGVPLPDLASFEYFGALCDLTKNWIGGYPGLEVNK